MTRLFVERSLEGEREVVFLGSDAHYLLNVLRMEPGDRLVVVDPQGEEYDVEIQRCARREVVGCILAARPAVSLGLELDLYPALLKGDRTELVIQKATELGVARITPVITERTIVRPDPARIPERVARWRKIAHEACRQCGRAVVPEIQEPLLWDTVLQQWAATDAPGVLSHEAIQRDAPHSLRHALQELRGCRRVAAFVGPEGGFTEAEVGAARAAGVRIVHLGPLILRAETAALAVCAIVAYELGVAAESEFMP